MGAKGSGVRRRAASLAAACLLALTACGAPASPAVEAPPAEPAAPAEPAKGLDLLASPSAVELSAFQAQMPPAEYAVLESCLPLLRGEETFVWTSGPLREDWSPREVTLRAFHDGFWGEEEDVPETLTLTQLSVVDLDGDGTMELILCFEDMLWQFLILHRENDAVYGTDLYVRWFEGLQQNGVYVGSGGAAISYYHTIAFQDGRFVEQDLGYESWHNGNDGPGVQMIMDYEIAGQPVTEAEFAAWRAELMVGDAAWYAP